MSANRPDAICESIECVSACFGSRGATGENGIMPNMHPRRANIVASTENACTAKYLELHKLSLNVYSNPGVEHDRVQSENSSIVIEYEPFIGGKVVPTNAQGRLGMMDVSNNANARIPTTSADAASANSFS
jgi:hypothetical protein